MKCRFIDTSSGDAYSNMAVDEALLALSSKPVLRVYQWKPSSISVGYSQSVAKEINMEECNKNNIPVVRRITGGKAIFHDSEITYSFVVPKKTIKMPEGVTESYKAIANALLIALRKIGIKVEIKKQPDRLATPICFSSCNWYEMTVMGKKICGSAQKRMDGRILQHGSLLIDFDYEKNAMLFRTDYRDTLESLKKRITSIRNELDKNISRSRLANAIKSGFEENFNADFSEGSLTKKETGLAESLKNGKYSRDEWNFRI